LLAGRNRKSLLFAVWSTSLSIALGLFVLAFKEVDFVTAFLTIGYGTLFAVLVRAIRSWRDLFSPITLILGASIFRYTVPHLLYSREDLLALRFVQSMGLTYQDFLLGHTLALTGMLGLAAGWLLVPGRVQRDQRPRSEPPRGTLVVASLGMGLGLVFFFLFVTGNVSDVGGTLTEGTFRQTEIQEGTGVARYLGLFLFSGSVLLSAYLLSRTGWPIWFALVPALIATLFYLSLGGRGRAMVPLLSALVLTPYVRPWKSSHQRGAKALLAVAVLVPMLVGIAYLGGRYRGGGLESVQSAFSKDAGQEYFETTFLVDVGHLHPLAAAVTLEPGALGGRKFIHALTWPLSAFVGYQGVSAGIYIVEQTTGPRDQDETFGLNPSLSGEAYLGFGLWAVPIITAIFGALIKMLYVRFRLGLLYAPIYGLAVIYAVQVFLGTIGVLDEALVVLVLSLLMIWTSRLLGGSTASSVHAREAVPATTEWN
jgi:oligosaccharide repeat unit polymerase